MTPEQKDLIVKAFERSADKAQNAMLHAKTALIDLNKHDDPGRAGMRAIAAFQEASKAQFAAVEAATLLDYVTSGDEN